MKFKITTLCLAFWAFTLASTAHAALGDSESALANDQKSFKAMAVKKTQTSTYTVHDLTLSGGSIKEYLNAAGTVFAVTWQGYKTPDLSVLLGSYYSEYANQEEQRIKTPGRKPASIKTSQAVVRRSGHMRDLPGPRLFADAGSKRR